MRATTSAQLDDLARSERQELFRVYVDDHTGTPVNYGEGASVNHLDAGSIAWDVDQFAARCELTLFREVPGSSLAPMVNANDPIAVGRDITVQTAIIAPSAAVTSGDWVTLFEGVIDRVSWGSDLLVIQARDPGGRLLDTWIESVEEYGSDSSPEQMEAVIQEILNTMSPADVTLDTPSAPSFGIVQYNQQRMSYADAIKALTDLIGWDARYKWDATASAFRLKLTEPDRTNTVPGHTFDADDYFDVSDIAKDSSGIRNVVEVAYTSLSAVVATNAASIAEFRRRYMYVDASEDPHITNSTLAGALASAIVSDLAQPLAVQVVENSFFWPLEIGDLIRWTANNHYTSDQDMAVTGFEHRFSSDPEQPAITLVRGRGRPSGGTTRWYDVYRRAAPTRGITNGLPIDNIYANVNVAPTGAVDAVVGASGSLSADLRGTILTFSWRVLGGTSAPTTASIAASGAIVNAAQASSGTVGVLASLTAGEVGWVGAIPYAAASAGGTAGNPVYAIERFGTTRDGIGAGDVVANKLTNQAKSFGTTVKFTTVTNNRVAWVTGTVALAGGSDVTVVPGSTGAFVSVAYIYFDGTSTLTTTTNVADLTSSEARVLLATAVSGPSDGVAQVWPAVSVIRTGGAPSVNFDNMSANSVTANIIQANAVTAAKIATFTMEVGKSIQSSNYSAGSAGWLIEDDNLEMNDATFRGALSAATGTFDGTVSGSSFTATTATFTGAIVAAKLQLTGGAPAATGELSATSVYANGTPGDLTNTGSAGINNLQQTGTLGFYGATRITKPTGVAVNVTAVHTALVSLGLIGA